MKYFLLAVLPALAACSNLSSQNGHTEYRTSAVTVYISPKLGQLSLAGVVIYDSPSVVDPDPPIYPK